MSFMRITCPWCGDEYTFGIVGRQPIGSGHRCHVQAFCDTEGCMRAGNFFVVDGWPEGETSFSCSEHIGGRAVAMCHSSVPVDADARTRQSEPGGEAAPKHDA